jgi:hypothetical protein
MRTGKFVLPIEGEPAEWLRAVHRGEVPFEDWWKRSLDLDARLVDLEGDDSLRDEPDRARIEAWSTTTHLAMWSRPPD